MGTRHLIAVQYTNEYKVAQYGQWDGYPSGQGVDVLNFLTPENIEKLKLSLSRCRFLDNDLDKEFIEDYDKRCAKWSNDPDNRTESQKNWFNNFVSRDLGAEVLTNIINYPDKIILKNSIAFAQDSLFCEYCYVVDLDKNTFEVYEGFNKEVINDERFESPEQSEEGYQQVKLKKVYNLNNLPSKIQFLNDCEPSEDNEDDEGE